MRGRIITDIMPLIDQVQQEMVAAMKSGDAARLSALRMLKAALMKLKVDSPKPIDEAAEMQVLKILIKQRIDAAEMFRKAGRAEQADKEEAEKAMLEGYLPAGASEEEIDAAIADAHGRNRRHFPQADGRRNEGRAGETEGQDRGRQSAER